MIAVACALSGIAGILSLTRRGRIFKSAFGDFFDTPSSAIEPTRTLSRSGFCDSSDTPGTSYSDIGTGARAGFIVNVSYI